MFPCRCGFLLYGAIAGDGILTICLEYQGYLYATSSSQRNLGVQPVLANGTWYATCSSQRNMTALDEPKSTTFDSGEPYLGLILSNRRMREVNRRMSSWPAFRTRHASYLFAHLIMGSGVIYYEYEKREKFEDYDMKAAAELGIFKIRRYHFDNESFVHPLHNVRFDPDRPYEISIEALMADKILSSSKDEKSSTERSRSTRQPTPHHSPRIMPVAQRERSTSSVKGTPSAIRRLDVRC
ncbi:hypothetical protein PIB30_036872 [Stylosanthes scabra]|uniref:Uncharacterized protein n=1 Tax=Stylosanthes scabra TaxID=79078 RepID=A0ABU6WGG5_9FABA|nr:hypothetical protein [Stylosanthes scabra]